MVTVPQNMIRLEQMLDYGGVRLQGFHCMDVCILSFSILPEELELVKI